jgi:hydroxyacylglutathione hydrolase
MKRALLLLLIFVALVPAARGQFSDPDGGDLERGSLPAKWTTGGPKCMEIPEWQVHEYNPDFFILRQSGCTDAEMPFLYLILRQGARPALGYRLAQRQPRARSCSASCMTGWSAITAASIPSHRHPLALARRPHLRRRRRPGAARLRPCQSTFVPADSCGRIPRSSSASHPWPDECRRQVDLGGRALNIVPTARPRRRDAIALYDPQHRHPAEPATASIPAASTFRDFPAYHGQHGTAHCLPRRQARRAHVLGNHIEQTQHAVPRLSHRLHLPPRRASPRV